MKIFAFLWYRSLFHALPDPMRSDSKTIFHAIAAEQSQQKMFPCRLAFRSVVLLSIFRTAAIFYAWILHCYWQHCHAKSNQSLSLSNYYSLLPSLVCGWTKWEYNMKDGIRLWICTKNVSLNIRPSALLWIPYALAEIRRPHEESKAKNWLVHQL